MRFYNILIFSKRFCLEIKSKTVFLISWFIDAILLCQRATLVYFVLSNDEDDDMNYE